MKKTDRPLLVIVGPTATGKTSLALELSPMISGEIISADSRQVYRGLTIGTGKDIPIGAVWDKKSNYWETKEAIKIWGYDIVSPEVEFSVAHFTQYASDVISSIWERGSLPILVGGTGLYIKGVVDGIETALIPRDEELRVSLKDKTDNELFQILSDSNPAKAETTNNSDKRNPRRLIRAIEVSGYWSTHKKREERDNRTAPDEVLWIGLTAPREALYKLIEKRVYDRIAGGIEEEIKGLLASGITWEHQSMASLGYREWKDYFLNTKSKEAVVQQWIVDEQRYVKRQMTWFKKDPRIEWFDKTKKGWQADIEKLVGKWHNKNT